MSSVIIRSGQGERVEEQVVELQVEQSEGALVARPVGRFLNALERQGAHGGEFDLVVDGLVFRRCTLAALGASATLRYVEQAPLRHEQS